MSRHILLSEIYKMSRHKNFIFQTVSMIPTTVKSIVIKNLKCYEEQYINSLNVLFSNVL